VCASACQLPHGCRFPNSPLETSEYALHEGNDNTEDHLPDLVTAEVNSGYSDEDSDQPDLVDSSDDSDSDPLEPQ
jgi:hypothetical protein